LRKQLILKPHAPRRNVLPRTAKVAILLPESWAN